MPTEAFITPELLRWARERDQVTTEDAAGSLNVAPERIQDWETGAAKPTIRQAQDLAKHYNIPFGYLFLDSPPADDPALPDLRTVGDEPRLHPSPDLWALINDVVAKQQWYQEYQEEENAEPLPFVGRYSLSDSAEEIAADIRRVTAIDESLRNEAEDVEDFLRIVVSRVERVGILVLRSGVVGNNNYRKLRVQEFRGFAISDNLAPLIFINGQDSPPAQVFTVGHELAHLWIGRSGISDQNYLNPSVTSAHEPERLCNWISAETFLPAEQVRSMWTDSRTFDENLRSVVRHFRTSRMAVLLRARDLGLITAETYHNYYPLIAAGFRGGVRRTGEGGNFYATLYSRNSRTLTSALMAALSEGRVSHRDAAGLLNVKVPTLGEVARHLTE